MQNTEHATAADIREDLLALALRHLRAAEAAMVGGPTWVVRRHLANFYAISEARA